MTLVTEVSSNGVVVWMDKFRQRKENNGSSHTKKKDHNNMLYYVYTHTNISMSPSILRVIWSEREGEYEMLLLSLVLSLLLECVAKKTRGCKFLMTSCVYRKIAGEEKVEKFLREKKEKVLGGWKTTISMHGPIFPLLDGLLRQLSYAVSPDDQERERRTMMRRKRTTRGEQMATLQWTHKRYIHNRIVW